MRQIAGLHRASNALELLQAGGGPSEALQRGEPAMDGFEGLPIAVGLLLAFEILAIRFGVDSRSGIGDDWSRSWLRWPSFPFRS
jgi:hypothetical protein